MNPNAISAVVLEVCRREVYLSGVGPLDELSGGVPRGGIVEIRGPESSGRAAMGNALLAAGTGRGEVCAVVDCHGEFDPAGAAGAGVMLGQIVWVRCGGEARHAFQAADALVHAGGFGVIVLDLCRMGAREVNRVPLSYWHRYRRAVEGTETVLAVLTAEAQVKSCAAMQVELARVGEKWVGVEGFRLLRGMEVGVAARKAARRGVGKMRLKVEE